jgi:hypothetical protein
VRAMIVARDETDDDGPLASRQGDGMAIDFCVDYACEAKAVLGTGGLFELFQARVAYEAARTGPEPRGEYEFWRRVVRGPHKDHVEMVTVGQLRRKSNRLIEFTSECDACPANVRGGPAGCMGRVTYPIDSPTERYLAAGAAAVVSAHDRSAALTFVEWIDEGPVDGRRVRAMRAASRRGVRFLELDRPLTVVAAEVSPPRRRVTTDQVLEMLFFGFPHARDGYHFSIPRDVLASHRAFFDFILTQLDLGHRRAALERSTTFEQLKTYARAIAIAEDLKVDLLVD